MSSIVVPIAVEFFGNSDGPDIVYTPQGFPGIYYGPNNWSDVIDAATNVYNGVNDYFNFASAMLVYLGALTVFLTANSTYALAGSPGSGPAYNTYQAALSTYNAAYLAWTIPPVDASNFYIGLQTYAPTSTFNAAAATYISAAEIYSVADYVWVNAGSPTSGGVWNTYLAALGVYDTAGNTWGTAQSTFANALAATPNPGNGQPFGVVPYGADWYEILYAYFLAAFNTYEAAYAVYSLQYDWLNTLELAIAWNAANPTSPNPYSTINPV
jgi:hypothetical protein